MPWDDIAPAQTPAPQPAPMPQPAPAPSLAPHPQPAPEPAPQLEPIDNVDVVSPTELASLAAMLESAFGQGVSIVVEESGKVGKEDVESPGDEETDGFDDYDGDMFFSEDEEDD